MNKTMFPVNTSRNTPIADTINEAGGKAYSFSPEHALAQYAVTGVFNNTFYVSAKDQIDQIKNLMDGVSNEFIGKLAIYARQNGNMKDMPAFLIASLLQRNAPEVFKRVFHRVINDGKMLRNFVQIIRSGQIGRTSLGSMSKKMVAQWFSKRDANKIFTNSIGTEPSIEDVIKLAHPRPASKEHEALFAYLLNKIDMNDKKSLKQYLPSLVKDFEEFKKNPTECKVPEIPFQFIASLNIPDNVWKEIAKTCSWQTLRMNLNTFERHGVMKDKKMVDLIAAKLSNENEVAKSKVFPYQLYTAFKFYNGGNSKIQNALQDAMDYSLSNIPSFGDNVIVCPDISGSMDSPVTGYRGTATTTVTCRDVAVLVASAILRKNQNAVVLPFSDKVARISLNPRDSVMTNASKLSRLPCGGTDCSAPLDYIIKHDIDTDVVIFVSDNESWVDTWRSGYNMNTFSGNVSTGGMALWQKIKAKNNKAKMVCIDVQPNTTTQFKERKDILNIGGFSDSVFDVINMFINTGPAWVNEINSIEL
jgi:60 kDa SS-A/Ro ribonucleoprotein